MHFRLVPLEERLLIDTTPLVDIMAETPSLGESKRLLIAPFDIEDASLLEKATLNNVSLLYYNFHKSTWHDLIAHIESSLNGARADSIAFLNAFPLSETLAISFNHLSDPLLTPFWKALSEQIKEEGSIDFLIPTAAELKAGVEVIRHNTSTDWLLSLSHQNAEELYFDSELLARWIGTLEEPIKKTVISEEEPPLPPQPQRPVDFEIEGTSGCIRLRPLREGQDGFTYQTASGALISITVSVGPAKPSQAPILTRAPEKGQAVIETNGSLYYTPIITESGIDFVGYETGGQEVRFIAQVIAPMIAGLTKKSHPPQKTTKIPVKHTPPLQDEESLYNSATTVAAFAISAQENDFPVGNLDAPSAESGDEQRTSSITEALKALFGKK